MFIGTFVNIRILTVGEWGVVQLAMSIGGTLGIYQHLGLVSASTREISSAKNDEDIFKIFVTSAVVRYCVTYHSPRSFSLIKAYSRESLPQQSYCPSKVVFNSVVVSRYPRYFKLSYIWNKEI